MTCCESLYRKFLNDCFVSCIYTTNKVSCKDGLIRLAPFIVVNKQSFFSYPPLASKAERDITYGIRAKLKRSDLMDSSTYTYVVNYVI